METAKPLLCICAGFIIIAVGILKAIDKVRYLCPVRTVTFP